MHSSSQDMHNSNSLRPVMMAPTTQEMLDAARVATLAGLPGGQSSLGQNGLGGGFTTTFAVPGLSGFPDIAFVSQIGQLFPQYAELAQLQKQQQTPNVDDRDKRDSSRGKTRSNDSRNSSAYASRHQAAEQRRRTRINERLELLRKMVPHAERANTACFLEEVIKYIDSLKRRNSELEVVLQDFKSTKPNQGEVEKHFLDYGNKEGHSSQLQQPSVSHTPPPAFSIALLQASQPQATKKPAYVTLGDDLMALHRSLNQGDGAAPGTPPAPAGPSSSDPLVTALLGRKANAESPASSEESGVPLKKRRMLVL